VNRAVDGVDLQVRTGAVYGVLGPNGAGKTTTINMLATLLRPDGGTGRVFGHDVVREPHVVRQLIGVTGQFASVDETLSATENLMIFSRLLGLSRSEAKAKSADLLDRSVVRGGEASAEELLRRHARRLDLAASLLAQPPLIFLDEPTGLDPRTRGQMWDTIRELVSTGSTVLLTTQYLDEADQLADRIAVIDRGSSPRAPGRPQGLRRHVLAAAPRPRPADTADALRAIEQTLGVRGVLPARRPASPPRWPIPTGSPIC
jgi:ABC-2 type transport system ATP-binding protein